MFKEELEKTQFAAGKGSKQAAEKRAASTVWGSGYRGGTEETDGREEKLRSPQKKSCKRDGATVPKKGEIIYATYGKTRKKPPESKKDLQRNPH